jgi:hypothetical protein
MEPNTSGKSTKQQNIFKERYLASSGTEARNLLGPWLEDVPHQKSLIVSNGAQWHIA